MVVDAAPAALAVPSVNAGVANVGPLPDEPSPTPNKIADTEETPLAEVMEYANTPVVGEATADAREGVEDVIRRSPMLTVPVVLTVTIPPDTQTTPVASAVIVSMTITFPAVELAEVVVVNDEALLESTIHTSPAERVDPDLFVSRKKPDEAGTQLEPSYTFAIGGLYDVSIHTFPVLVGVVVPRVDPPNPDAKSDWEMLVTVPLSTSVCNLELVTVSVAPNV